MSEYITANITRGSNTTVAQGISMLLDKMGAAETSYYQGADPHFTYKVTTLQLPTTNRQLVLQGDHMVDQNVTDAKTNALRQFLIISDPEPGQLNMSWRWVAVRMRGT